MADQTIQTLATEARSYFHQHKRGDDDVIWTYDRDTTPQWVQDMTFAAHDAGNMLPDDWRYQFIVDALDLLSDADDPDDVNVESDIYTHELAAWLASRADRIGYCDDAVEEFGVDSKASMFDRLSWGQYMERSEVMASVRQSLADRLESLESEEETEADETV